MKTAFLFDLDGTITRQELLPIIAREGGLEQEIAVLTKATVSGVLPFEGSFKLRVKLLSDLNHNKINGILENADLYDEVCQFIRHNIDNSFIVTGNLSVWISGLAKRIGCECFCAEAEILDEKISSIKKLLDKGSIPQILRQRGYDRIVAVGEGMNDVPMFLNADIGIAYGATHQPASSVMDVANYVVFHERGLCNLLNTLLS